jgi:hypothetical protein
MMGDRLKEMQAKAKLLKKQQDQMKQFIPQTLEVDKDDDTMFKRVKVEIIDLDWIFQGQNAKILIKLLADQNNSKIYVQRTINLFVSFMWKFYQKAIIRYIFLPFCFYMFTFLFLCTVQVGEFVSSLKTEEELKAAREA